MTTFTELLSRLHQERFVGRDAELSRLESWLASNDEAPIMAVSGVGGIGKSWLLAAFGRTAAERGWLVRQADAGAVRAIEASQPLLAGPVQDKTLYVIDSIESLGPAVSRLQEELAGLEQGTRVVLSGRQRLHGRAWRQWEPLMRHLELGALGREEQRRYLDVRGVDDLAHREQVLMRTGGHPLTLSLAVDLLVNAPDAELGQSPRWRSAVRMTVDELVSEVGALFSEAVQAAAVLHRFDRAALAAVLGPENADAAFVRLCSLSMTMLVEDQLALHDEVRRAVIEDLRLHDPRRLDTVRRRALRYYRRVAAATGGEAGLQLSIARLHMVGRDIFGLGTLYEDDPEFDVTAAGP
ncbi:MAG: hypothetical protein JWO57_3743, partial [Pseudonocardiales bacterium]|nr:hypothetical protein [Pseudonocardiales bacterium]